MNVTIDNEVPVSRLFGYMPKPSKAVLKGEKRLRALQDTLKPTDPSLAWYETFNKLTGFNVKVKVNQDDVQAKNNHVNIDSDENIVAKI